MSSSADILAHRRTVHFWPDRIPIAGGVYGQMFAEDVQTMVAPIGGRAYVRTDFKVRCEPDDEATVDRVLRALDPVHRNRYRGLADATCEFIRYRAAQLAYFGDELFELVQDSRGGLAIVPLPRPSARLLGPALVQVLPVSLARRAGRRIIVVPRKFIWHLTLPHKLGGARAHHELLRSLAVRVLPPAWANAAVEAGRQTDFDRAAYERIVDQHLLSWTSTWGWPARWMADKRMSIYHRIRRELTFAWALALVRGHILEELNAAFAQAQLRAVLSFENLPSAGDARAALERLERGSGSFSEILAMVRW